MTTRQPIQTAIARGGAIEIPVDYGEAGGVQVYRFSPGIGVQVLDVMDRFMTAAGPRAKMDAVIEFIEAVALPGEAERIADAVRSGLLDYGALGQIGVALVEEVTGRRPTSPPNSGGGSSTTGSSSTDGAPPEASTPRLSPPTVS